MPDDTIDADTLDRMISYCGGAPRQPRKVIVEAFAEYANTDWPLIEFQKIIASVIEGVPAECRDSAIVELKGGYDESTVLKISYTRKSTPEEDAGRTFEALKYVNRTRRTEREQYERLKAKYDN